MSVYCACRRWTRACWTSARISAAGRGAVCQSRATSQFSKPSRIGWINASMRSRRSSSAYGCPSRSEVETPSARAQAAMRAGEAGFCPHSTFDKSDLETLARWASPCCNKPRCLRIRAIRAPVCSSMLCGTMNSVLRQHSDGTRGRQSQIRRTLISSVTRQEPSSRRRPAVRRPVRAVFRSRTGPWPRQANAPAHSPSQAAVRTQRR
jgi:hypothetical protein